MMQLLNALELDLLISHEGHEVALQASGGAFVARFESFASLVHFFRAAWPSRKLVPAGIDVRVEWSSLGLQVQRRVRK